MISVRMDGPGVDGLVWWVPYEMIDLGPNKPGPLMTKDEWLAAVERHIRNACDAAGVEMRGMWGFNSVPKGDFPIILSPTVRNIRTLPSRYIRESPPG